MQKNQCHGQKNGVRCTNRVHHTCSISIGLDERLQSFCPVHCANKKDTCVLVNSSIQTPKKYAILERKKKKKTPSSPRSSPSKIPLPKVKLSAQRAGTQRKKNTDAPPTKIPSPKVKLSAQRAGKKKKKRKQSGANLMRMWGVADKKCRRDSTKPVPEPEPNPDPKNSKGTKVAPNPGNAPAKVASELAPKSVVSNLMTSALTKAIPVSPNDRRRKSMNKIVRKANNKPFIARPKVPKIYLNKHRTRTNEEWFYGNGNPAFNVDGLTL
jgi:hypothetical protein